jgi:hypothetical protein
MKELEAAEPLTHFYLVGLDYKTFFGSKWYGNFL